MLEVEEEGGGEKRLEGLDGSLVQVFGSSFVLFIHTLTGLKVQRSLDTDTVEVHDW